MSRVRSDVTRKIEKSASRPFISNLQKKGEQEQCAKKEEINPEQQSGSSPLVRTQDTFYSSTRNQRAKRR